MIVSRIEIIVPYSDAGNYKPDFSFRLPEGEVAVKLTIISRDANAVVQVREGDGDFPLEAISTEQAADRGFTSFVYETPITGWRFRCREPGKTTRLSFTAYG